MRLHSQILRRGATFADNRKFCLADWRCRQRVNCRAIRRERFCERPEDGKERKEKERTLRFGLLAFWQSRLSVSVCLSGAMGETAGGCGAPWATSAWEDRLEDGTMTITTPRLPSPLHAPSLPRWIPL
ncbi:hypothetical protein NA56DRAFT_30993 [Hyaloscypha hepaticicola]|uniref:Uncharacterized protein n=1 Tax=Hyaloscypha hepaticicola TaxID=2082293 RepID=A0A2J6QD69_9HELO|nr:hypothetical protein NA56DRAFT_30993 [Hyaloscypha hepaticicola]